MNKILRFFFGEDKDVIEPEKEEKPIVNLSPPRAKIFEEVTLRNGQNYIVVKVEGPDYYGFRYVVRIYSGLYGTGLFQDSAEKFTSLKDAKRAADNAIEYDWNVYQKKAISRKQIEP